MQVVGIVSPGAMGSAVGAAYAAEGHRVVATIEARSQRTAALAAHAGLELLPDLDAVVAESDLVLSIVPPDQALATAAAVAAAASANGARPLVADWNAVAPTTALELERLLAAAGLEFVDGSISGGPPRADYRTRVYLSGRSAARLAESAPEWLEVRVVGEDVGLASAVKMCTASMYKGSMALLTHALVTAQAHGVLGEVLDDLHDSFPKQIERAARAVAVTATKAERYVGEMHEIAATQQSVGLPAELFDGMAAAYAAIARTSLARRAPEEIADTPVLEDVLRELCGREDLNLQGPKPTGT